MYKIIKGPPNFCFVSQTCRFYKSAAELWADLSPTPLCWCTLFTHIACLRHSVFSEETEPGPCDWWSFDVLFSRNRWCAFYCLSGHSLWAESSLSALTASFPPSCAVHHSQSLFPSHSNNFLLCLPRIAQSSFKTVNSSSVLTTYELTRKCSTTQWSLEEALRNAWEVMDSWSHFRWIKQEQTSFNDLASLISLFV